MNNDTIFLYIIAALALSFAFTNCIQFLTKRNRTAQVIGTITSIKTPNPTKSNYRNSKWAIVSYKVNGKTYESKKRIQVPLYSQIGTTVMIRYDKFNPEKLYCFSGLRIMISFLIAVTCILIVTFKLV